MPASPGRDSGRDGGLGPARAGTHLQVTFLWLRRTEVQAKTLPVDGERTPWRLSRVMHPKKLCVRRPRGPPAPGSVLPAGGYLEKGKVPSQALQRFEGLGFGHRPLGPWDALQGSQLPGASGTSSAPSSLTSSAHLRRACGLGGRAPAFPGFPSHLQAPECTLFSKFETARLIDRKMG